MGLFSGVCSGVRTGVPTGVDIGAAMGVTAGDNGSSEAPQLARAARHAAEAALKTWRNRLPSTIAEADIPGGVGEAASPAMSASGKSKLRVIAALSAVATNTGSEMP